MSKPKIFYTKVHADKFLASAKTRHIHTGKRLGVAIIELIMICDKDEYEQLIGSREATLYYTESNQEAEDIFWNLLANMENT